MGFVISERYSQEAPLKHTRGPWAYEIFPCNADERTFPKSKWTGLYIGPEGDCEYTGMVDHTIFEGGFSHSPKDGDPEADAKLITAAPELLEALIMVRDTMASWVGYNDDGFDQKALAMIDRAIAKAVTA